ncbi:MAG: hypothetical protein LBM76_00615 [Mycoplasmataceae bacterium]|nr:hypothetical protein [Mycoplasmataceae bacterium]
MRYLIFDCECLGACDFNGNIKILKDYLYKGENNRQYIWQFGYILFDDTFNIVKKDILTINPTIDLTKDYPLPSFTSPGLWTDEKKNEVFNLKTDFTTIHSLLEQLINDNTIVINQGLISDLIYIKSDCERFGLPYKEIIGCRLEDLTSFYIEQTGLKIPKKERVTHRTLLLEGVVKEESGLEHLARFLGIEVKDAHQALGDCMMVYGILSKYCKDLNFSNPLELITESKVLITKEAGKK